MRDWIVYSMAGGFLGGVFLRSFFVVSYAFALVFSLIGIALFLYTFIVRTKVEEILGKRSILILFSVFIISLSLGILRYSGNDNSGGDEFLYEKVGTEVDLIGVITNEPDQREQLVRYIVLIDNMIDGTRTFVTKKTKILVSAESYPRYEYGDKINVRGKLLVPQSFEDDRGKVFDYGSYLRKDDIFFQMIRPKIEVVAHNEGGVVKKYLFGFKNALLRKVDELLPSPHSALLGGMTIGGKQTLSRNIQDDFARAGIIHIVVLSGYNITLVAKFIIAILFFLPALYANVLGIVAIVLFAIMTGATATVIRASVMAILVIVARMVRRPFSAGRALLVAAVVMVALNPKILIFDTSFQLSFLATLGLVYVSPIVLRYVQWVPEQLEFREMVSATLATQITVLPLLLYKIGTLSFISLPVNLLVLPLMPVIMLLGFITIGLGFIHYFVAFPFSFILYILLSYIFKIVDIGTSIPYAAISVSYFPWWLMVLCYTVIGFLFWKMKKPHENSRKA